MKVHVTGFQRMSGISKKTGNPYNMASIFVLLPMEQHRSDNRVSLGYQGDMYDNVDPEIVRRLEQHPLPFEAEIEMIDIIRFGKKQSQIVDVKPLPKKAP